MLALFLIAVVALAMLVFCAAVLTATIAGWSDRRRQRRRLL